MKTGSLKLIFLFFLLLTFFLGVKVQADTQTVLESESVPSLISALRIESPLEFCRERVPLENFEVRERLEKELLLMLWDRPQIILWLKRSKRYFPYIEKSLNRHGMPQDLKYITVIESSLLSHAGSPKNAMGYWQFIEETGRNYGLVIDENIDERRNFYTSTDAALSYLQNLHDVFGSWTLAAAAYNLGEDRLQFEMKSQQVDSYYQFYLPQETQRYIFRILAAKLILSNPSRYGFHLDPEDYYSPEVFDRVKITLPVRTPLYLIAQAADTYFKRIKDLNPQILGHELPRGTHIVAVPRGKGENFHERFKPLTAQWRQEYKTFVYVIKKGDNLSDIADRFHVNLTALMTWNDLAPGRHIHPGEKIVIYQ